MTRAIESIRLEPFDASRRDDFLSVMGAGSGESARCFCTAFHVEDWDAPGKGLACRERLIGNNVSDGFLLYVDGRAAGWCQCGPWDSFGTLSGRPPAVRGAWAITCVVLARDVRGRGLAHALFGGVLDELRRRGVSHVYAFAHRLGPTYSSPLAELPEAVCRKAGMTLEHDDPECPVYGLRLAPGGV